MRSSFRRGARPRARSAFLLTLFFHDTREPLLQLGAPSTMVLRRTSEYRAAIRLLSSPLGRASGTGPAPRRATVAPLPFAASTVPKLLRKLAVTLTRLMRSQLSCDGQKTLFISNNMASQQRNDVTCSGHNLPSARPTVDMFNVSRQRCIG